MQVLGTYNVTLNNIMVVSITYIVPVQCHVVTEQ